VLFHMMRSSTFLKAIAFAALVGWLAIDVYMGVADQLRGISPIVLFQWDASNIIGSTAFSDGLRSASLGLVFDLIVSIAWAALCAVIMFRSETARSHPIWFGALLGALVMFVMLWIIVPLGRAHQAPMSLSNFMIVLAGHTLFFGIPLAVTVRAALNAEQVGQVKNFWPTIKVGPTE